MTILDDVRAGMNRVLDHCRGSPPTWEWARRTGPSHPPASGGDGTPKPRSDGGTPSNAHGSDTRGSDTGREDGAPVWSEAGSPTDKTLRGVVQTAKGPYAVGADGNVLTRAGDSWQFVIETGPSTKRNELTAVDATDDGKRVWFAGSSGSLGVYDLRTGRKHDYSAPMGKTSTWEAVAATGPAGDETLRLANGSGEVLPVTVDDAGCPQWGEVVKPGSGSSVTALDYGRGRCYVVDTSGNAFAETDDGWERIGVDDAQVNFYDVAVTDGAVLIAGGDGRAYRYYRPCDNWTPVAAGTGALRGVDSGPGLTLTVAAGGGIFERTRETGWTPVESSVEADLLSVTLGDPPVAVGADGTIVERDPTRR